ncbi:MAG: hypothetical protein ACI8Y7_001062 [Candidatus Woesearchaeota archaeon]|jgi:hypothetical protein
MAMNELQDYASRSNPSSKMGIVLIAIGIFIFICAMILGFNNLYSSNEIDHSGVHQISTNDRLGSEKDVESSQDLPVQELEARNTSTGYPNAPYFNFEKPYCIRSNDYVHWANFFIGEGMAFSDSSFAYTEHWSRTKANGDYLFLKKVYKFINYSFMDDGGPELETVLELRGSQNMTIWFSNDSISCKQVDAEYAGHSTVTDAGSFGRTATFDLLNGSYDLFPEITVNGISCRFYLLDDNRYPGSWGEYSYKCLSKDVCNDVLSFNGHNGHKDASKILTNKQLITNHNQGTEAHYFLKGVDHSSMLFYEVNYFDDADILFGIDSSLCVNDENSQGSRVALSDIIWQESEYVSLFSDRAKQYVETHLHLQE